jgi:hypothetical protein
LTTDEAHVLQAAVAEAIQFIAQAFTAEPRRDALRLFVDLGNDTLSGLIFTLEAYPAPVSSDVINGTKMRFFAHGDNQASNSSTDQGGGSRRAGIYLNFDLNQSAARVDFL